MCNRVKAQFNKSFLEMCIPIVLYLIVRSLGEVGGNGRPSADRRKKVLSKRKSLESIELDN